RGKIEAEKGDCNISFEDILEFAEGQIFIVLSPADLKREVFASKHPLPLREGATCRAGRRQVGGGESCTAPSPASSASRTLRPLPQGEGEAEFTGQVQSLSEARATRRGEVPTTPLPAPP